MKKPLRFIALIIFFISPSSNATESVNLDVIYEIYHDITIPEKPKLTITCEFNKDIIEFKRSKKDKKDFFYLELPDKWSNAHDLHEHINNLRGLDSQTKIIDAEEKNIKKVITNPSQKWIAFTYDIYPQKKINLFDPLINQDVFHFIGRTALIYPRIDLDKELNVKMVLKKPLKDTGIFASSIGTDLQKNINISYRIIKHSAFAGGKYHVDELSADNSIMYSYGLKKQTKADIVEYLNKIIPIQKNFWNENKNKNNIIFVHANDFVQTTMTGTCIHKTLCLLLNETSPFIKEDLPEFLAHEHWHTWMGSKFYSRYGYKSMAWLFEGITDYYGHKTAYQAGVIDLASWNRKYNRILENHYLSPVKNKSNQDISHYFNEDPQYEKLPYNRGEIIAMELDNRIQLLSAGKYSLDNVIKDMFSDESKHDYVQKDFQNALQKYYPGAKKFVEQYIVQGRDMPLSDTLFDSRNKLQWQTMKPENYGLDLKSTLINQEISGLSSKTNAYQKGLRNGQKVVSHHVNNQDINKPITLRILNSDGSTQDVFLERIGKNLPIPQYHISS